MLRFFRKLLVARSGNEPPTSKPAGSRLFDGSTFDNEEALSAAVRAWLVSLPAEFWPQQICVRRPEVANEIARLWANGDCDDYFVELMLDDSIMGSEAPPAFREELICLEAFYLQAKVEAQPTDKGFDRASSV